MQKKMHVPGSISRRAFLEAAGVIATAGGLALPGRASLAASPRRGGTLTVAIDRFGEDSWLVHLFGGTSVGPPSLVYEYLLYTDAEDSEKLIPGLAESWSHKNFKEWTFNIRKGVHWDKGQGELTADDVAFSLTLIAGADAKSVDAPYWRARLKSMKVVDRYTLRFSLQAVDPLVGFFLSSHRRSQVVCKKYIESVGLDKADREPVGTGPYRLTKFVQGVEAEFQAIDRPHWRVAPKWDRIIFRTVPESTTRLAMLATKNADVALVGPDQLGEAKRRGFALYPVEVFHVLPIVFGGLWCPGHPRYTGKEPWHDIRVREAMAIAIDRVAINKTFFSGMGSYEGMPGANVGPLSAVAQHPMPYDPERARRLLKEANRQGFAVKIVSFAVPGQPQTPEVLQAVAGYWQAIGLRPEIVPMDRLAFRSRWLKDETNDLVYAWGANVTPGYESRIEKIYYCKDVGSNFYSDPHVDAVFEQLRETTVPEMRAKMVADLQLYLRRQWAAIQIVNTPMVTFAALPGTVGSWKPRMVGEAMIWEYLEPA